MKKIKEFLSSGKAKVLTLVGAGLVATNAMAEVTFDNGKFNGTIETTPFTSAVVVVIGLIGLIYAVRAALSLFKR
jgi:hypothetical protein